MFGYEKRKVEKKNIKKLLKIKKKRMFNCLVEYKYMKNKDKIFLKWCIFIILVENSRLTLLIL